MKDQLVSFECAKLAKEKDFILDKDNEPILQIYENNGKLEYEEEGYVPSHPDTIYAPTQSLLAKWLREKHNIYVWVTPSSEWICFYCKENPSISEEVKRTKVFETYEEALEVGLLQALKLIKTP